MEELIKKLSSGFDGMASPVLLLSRDENGEWGCVYKNAASFPVSLEELLAGIGPTLDAGGEHWAGDVGDVPVDVRFAALPEGLTLVLPRDVTRDSAADRERAEAANAALRSALDAANAASRAKSDFLSNMSHDIRTPLNAIIGMTTIARAHLDERERVEDCLDKIGFSSRHLLGLINDILDMSRIESGKMSISVESFTMADFLHSLMAVFRPQAEKKRQRVSLDFTGIRHEHIRGDQLRIQQVLINILSNAVKFTPEEGEIALTVREMGKAAFSGRAGAYYQFVVRDTGMGMTPEFLKRVFMPFERAEGVARVEGTGLGMAITNNLVKMMNGEIAVESEVGRGTCFTVTLPLEQEADDEAGLQALRGLRVLAADSDGASLGNLREILEDLGMECDAVSTGWEATELAAQARMEGRGYFAILLGWRLPAVDGVQICRELRELLGGEVPILIMSAYEWTLTADEMKKNGVSAFIPKPLFRSRLGEALYAFTPEGRAAVPDLSRDGVESFHGRNVLLVEDNEINREIGTELIEMLGAAVECAENGKQAVDMFNESPAGRFDLIFMDIQMPVMDGLAAAGAIRRLQRPDAAAIPIVAMSANAFVEDIRTCLEAGMNDHISKPVSLQGLSDVMAKYLSAAPAPEGGALR